MAHRILVIRLSSLGDVVLTAPVYRSLKARWPECHVAVLVKPAFAAALEGNPNIDEIIPFHGLSDAAARIRRGGFDKLLDLHGTFRSWLLRKLARVGDVAVYKKHAIERRLFVAFGLRSPLLEKHTVERYLEALAPWGVRPLDAALRLDDWRASAGPSLGGPARKILVIQSAFLGDSLLTLPLLRGLKSACPEASLAVLTSPRGEEIFRGCEWADEVIRDDKRGADGGLLGTWRMARSLKDRDFDLAVIPHRSLRSALLAWLAGIPTRLGFDSSAGRLLLTRTVPFTWSLHDLERNLSLLLPLTPDLGRTESRAVFLSDPGPDDAPQELRSLADAGPLVGVHPGSAWATKRWPAERYAELCRRLRDAGFAVVLVGSRDDARLCGAIAAESGAFDFSGKTDIRQLKALIARLKLFITNDSGPMHIATGLAVPTLAIFGPTTRELGFFPYGPGHQVLEVDLACRPCRLHGGDACPEGHFLCMRLIPVERVQAAALAMLGAPKVAA